MSQALQEFDLMPQNSPLGLQFTKWINDHIPVANLTDVPDQVASPCLTAAYLNGLRDTTIAATKLKPLIRITDGNIDVMTELEGEISCEFEYLTSDTGTLKIELLYDNWLVDWITNQTMPISDLNILVDPNPLKPDWRTRWGGKITEIHVKQDDRGIHGIELTALHFREHAKRLLVAANPLFPPEIQLPKMWVMPGPMRTVFSTTAFVNLGRLFMPGWSAIANIFNPAGWINPLGADAVLNVLPTEWPIQVAFCDTALDQSRWGVQGSTWTTWHDSFKDNLNDAGVAMNVYTYLTSDEDSPNDELVKLLTAAPDLLARLLGIDVSELDEDIVKLCAPQRNCVIFKFEQIDGRTGPTGTAWDGLLDTIAVTLDDLITPVTIDLATGDTFDPGNILNGETVEDASGIGETQLLEQLLDVAPIPPKVIWWDGTYNGLLSSDLTFHKGSVKTVMTGSKSPVLVNEAQTFAIRYGLSQLADVLNEYSGIFDTTGQLQTPMSEGLDNLYQGQLDNTLLAWQRYTDPIRALYAGDVAWQEHFEKGSGTAYTLASVVTLRDGNWKTRPFAAFKAEALNGHPWIANTDFRIGDRVGFERNGIIYVDNCYGIKYQYDWDNPLKVTLKIGEDKQKSDPFGLAFKTLSNMWNFVGQLAGQGTIFDA
ncbi:Gp37-like protein [Mycolicibacterium sphagni]|uniref:Gp37-like protein n=1 Tax=Mycolicibacterium sphagni TaxID=1786 RepID=UPI0021F35425|nr:hypothetical protein [Mycolicibacterium sphagni]MCV7174933.1 hypothetical protein [Mycolicibacterium sphagni]